MNDLRMPPPGDLPGTGDHLDRLFAEYFKSKIRHPWPKAPATPARLSGSEPSVLVGVRNAGSATNESDRNGAPAFPNQEESSNATRHGRNKSRSTLALSVVALFGTCWLLSNTFPAGEQGSTVTNANRKVPGVLLDATAEKPAVLEQMKKDNAEQGNSKKSQKGESFLK